MILILLEFKQIWVVGKEKYFNDIYNYLDLIGFGSSIYFGALHMLHGIHVYISNTKLFLIIALITLGLRAITQLRIFTSFRDLIELIRQTQVDMVPFLVILFLILFLMSTIGILLEDIDVSVIDNLAGHFLHIIGSKYQILFGENPDRAELSNPQWANYILFTVLLNIICFNLLISILSNTYDNVQATIDATDCRTKAEMIHEICMLMSWKRS